MYIAKLIIRNQFILYSILKIVPMIYFIFQSIPDEIFATKILIEHILKKSHKIILLQIYNLVNHL